MVQKYIDSGTGEIKGPTNQYKWKTTTGDIGNNIQAIGPANNPGTSTSFARDNHVHEGVHSLRANSGPELFGNIVFTPGFNTIISQLGQNLTIGQEPPVFGTLYYDAGVCGAERPLEIICGPCENGMTTISNLSEGPANDITLDGLSGEMTLNTPGDYRVSFDISCISADLTTTAIKAQIVGKNSGNSIAKALNFSNLFGLHLSAHGFFLYDFETTETIYIQISTQGNEDPAIILINHLQFTAQLIRRS